MKVIEPPKLTFKCDACGAMNEGEEREFTPIPGTQPMGYRATCGWCHCTGTYYPTPLIKKQVGMLFLNSRMVL